MKLNWARKDFESDIEFILYHQQDNTPEWWRKQLFNAYPYLNYEHAKSLPESKRFEYITEQMRQESQKYENVINDSVKVFQDTWNTLIVEKLESAYRTAFGNDCSGILNNMVAEVGLNPICPRDLEHNSFSVYYRDIPRYAMMMALHEITHFVWFYFWQQHFSDNSDEYDFPNLKWLLSEIVVETIIRNSKINDLIEQPKYIAYSYFYSMTINNELIFDTMKKMYQSRTNIYDFMNKSFDWIQKNEPELRKKIAAAEK